MLYTRRDLGKIALAAGTAAAFRTSKPNSTFGGVQIGVITYSFRTLPGSAEETLKYCVDCGISGIELMSNVAESYAGAPAPPGRGFGPGGGPPPGAGRPGAGAPAGGRPALTPEQQAAMRKGAEELKQWRLSVSMDKYKAFRKMYENAGVKIHAFKLPPTMAMSDQEYEYIWDVAKTLGADHITMELPTDDALLKRVADYAAKRKLRIAFHTHGQGGSSGFDKVLGASKYTALNFDVGHYYGVNGESPVPIIEKYHDRMASLHLKDRKGPNSASAGAGPGRGGANMPWGQGETPLREVLQVMKNRKYRFPAFIEYEYNTPEGSDVLTEVKKCVEFCRAALA
ncbi:MAG: sugar phosphate isomerase/epimerase [Acidobacteria bacterium]|nr:MAG: sugar phosphate isomerase/epimerase [Acidobacteriota bacterium]